MSLMLITIFFILLIIGTITQPTDDKRTKLVRNARVFVADSFDAGFGVIVDYQPRECVHPGGLFSNSLYKKEAWLVKLDDTENSRWFEYHEIQLRSEHVSKLQN